MIQSIEIENFRCFHQTKLEGFKRVNLIGGQNNAGKTALLEAVYAVKGAEAVQEIQAMRVASSQDQNFPEDYISNIFFNKNSNVAVRILVLKQNLIANENNNYVDYNIGIKIKTDYGRNYIERILKVDNNELMIDRYYYNKDNSIKHDVYGALYDEYMIKNNLRFVGNLNSKFLRSYNYLKGKYLANSYDNVYKEDLYNYVINAFRIFIPEIEDVRSADPEAPSLYIKTKGNKPLPISMFGDAVNRMAEFVLRIIEARGGVVLIDEIENGIHYSHHKEVWSALFKLAKLFDVQLFATSHSLEMIRAFNEVAMNEGFEEDAQYIEMFRSARSGEIVGNLMTLETLAYSLRTGKTFRGE